MNKKAERYEFNKDLETLGFFQISFYSFLCAYKLNEGMSYLFSFLIFRFCKNAFLILQVKVPVLECRVIITEPVTDAPLFLNVFVDQDFRATTVQGVSLFTLQCKLKNLGVFLFLILGFCFCFFFFMGGGV